MWLTAVLGLRHAVVGDSQATMSRDVHIAFMSLTTT
jgi:hypothetical protein